MCLLIIILNHIMKIIIKIKSNSINIEDLQEEANQIIFVNPIIFFDNVVLKITNRERQNYDDK